MRRPSLDARRLASLAPALDVEVLEEATSTNAVAADRARAGAAEGHVVVAEQQTAGRGRLDRTWHTPPRAALLFSVVLRPTVAAADWPWLPLLTGLSVSRALQGLGYDAGVKWPNDVLVAGADGESRKLVGILVERVETPDGPAAVVGVGINVSLTAAELPVPTATSLAIESGTEPDRTAVLATVLSTLVEAYDAWQAGGAESHRRLAASYAAACVTVGRDVRVEMPSGKPLLGRATGVDRGGRLLVDGPDGQTAVGAGDVVHVRAVDR
ncbi:biotin--acetyl-CoA-carboxylase ligase [Nocardioides sp. Root1257]|uniref:biotin--[acetyl-CoA-carboxylase] ligase n=1 Tax=unclassified Nocardioides TaxID=2615069 RepID=UPI0006F89972|nr:MULTISPECIES: biotin--[acetyl-CoA-carboxylase] ligase [unclassified Nocardioides]KQW45251.1 biotin--acetyl-CoA-carboxylase ligase [Nocardioides sp. Root1257]KRC52576.1 biotin--acetyl-CoA-carboxylase ligase [Nocardioides sp. Root224]